MSRRPNSQKILHLASPMAVLIVFLSIAAVYVAMPAFCAELMRVWGIPVFDCPFLDLQAIISALVCKRHGFDVMQSNPCDVLGRPFIYSPLWLEASIIPIDHRGPAPAGVTLGLHLF